MKLRVLLVLAVFSTLTGPTAQAAASLEKCTNTLGKFRQLGNVPELLAESYGYAVLPTIGKGGIGIGGAGGTGCVFARGKHTGKVSMGQITIGWQLGGQAYSQIIRLFCSRTSTSTTISSRANLNSGQTPQRSR